MTGGIRRSHEEIKEIVEKAGYVLLDEYCINYAARQVRRMVIIKDKDGYKYDVSVDQLKSGRIPYFVAVNNKFSLINISKWLKINNLKFKLSENNIYKGKESELEFYCLDKNCKETFYRSWNNLRNHPICPFCSKTQVGKNNNLQKEYPNVVCVWNYTKNKTQPYQYVASSKENFYWLCENNIHKSYKRTIHNSIRCDFRCPKCSKESKDSLLQKKVCNYLIELEFSTLHEKECNIVAVHPNNNRDMPYDNEVIDLNLIIEVNGEQHYALGGWHRKLAKRNNTTPQEEFEYQKWRDRYKKEYAIGNGYEYLEIPYSSDDGNETWKKLINDKINKILQKNLL